MTPLNDSRAQPRLFIPALAPLYAAFGGLSWALLRFLAGGALVTHGWGKIVDPLARVDFVEGIGFYPGWLWAPLLAVAEFFGGILLAIGLLTRPAALAATVVLLVTVWYHWVLQNEGFFGAEKSILWAAITFFFLIHGGGRFSLDRALKREF